MRKIKCGHHGTRKWKRHISCAGCGRVFDQKEAEVLVKYNENLCPCGLKLMPEKGKPEDDFSARAICPSCYRKSKKENIKNGLL